MNNTAPMVTGDHPRPPPASAGDRRACSATTSGWRGWDKQANRRMSPLPTLAQTSGGCAIVAQFTGRRAGNQAVPHPESRASRRILRPGGPRVARPRGHTAGGSRVPVDREPGDGWWLADGSARVVQSASRAGGGDRTGRGLAWRASRAGVSRPGGPRTGGSRAGGGAARGRRLS
ncbi:hypothetical protein MANES_17G026976v8 [Manihot esculenta]|uniref:Uncharacterized protein n=1 Tax=Manihot esculenta TaxID=3983 RepID=A0ACB7G6G0_MANES|nr:hypothetical protein MANES_17G026976v8 [Manihot esculenta]